MDAVVFHAHSIFNSSSCFSFSNQLNLRKFSYSLKDGPSSFPLLKGVLQLSISSIKSDGSRRGRSSQENPAARTTKKENKSEKYQFSDGKLPKSPKQEEVIALLRRIKFSVSKGKAKSTHQKDIKLSEEKPPMESVSETLHQSKKPGKDATPKSRQDRGLTQKRQVPKKDHKLQNDARHLAEKFNLTRPASKFIKRSPIPFPSMPRGSLIELNSDPSAAAETEEEASKFPRIGEMKLPELKELAKSRGIKGYSKLKKGELLELLRS